MIIYDRDKFHYYQIIYNQKNFILNKAEITKKINNDDNLVDEIFKLIIINQ